MLCATTAEGAQITSGGPSAVVVTPINIPSLLVYPLTKAQTLPFVFNYLPLTDSPISSM